LQHYCDPTSDGSVNAFRISVGRQEETSIVILGLHNAIYI